MTTQQISNRCAAACGHRTRTWAAAVAAGAVTSALIQLMLRL